MVYLYYQFYMDWLEVNSNPEEDTNINFKKLEKFTLYEHNYVYDIDEEAQTFSCMLNCKRLNRLFSTVCQIEGDLKAGQINISCRLLDQEHIIHGQWEYQRIELTRFAFRYNERSYRNIFIRTNPLNGSVVVTLSFMTGAGIVEDDKKFKEIITDLCHIVGQESQMIFNTMLEVIFGREANEPYLKSAIKVNPGFPRYMKVEKLLDKIKSLIATSSFYKIRSDISSAHKNRSHFKKIFLNSVDRKFISNPKIVQMALVYEMKFNKKYEESEKKPREKPQQFIKDYIELEQKNEIEFAKHLNENSEIQYNIPSMYRDQIIRINIKEENKIYLLQFSGNRTVEATALRYNKVEYEHYVTILTKIGNKHPNMSDHFVPAQPSKEIEGWIFVRYENEIPICDFLRKNSRTISLSTKLHIMSQICSFFQYLHKQNVGYFIQIENIFITKGLEVRIRGFQRSLFVKTWTDNKKEEERSKVQATILKNMPLKAFPYRYLLETELDNEKCDVMSLGVCLYRILLYKLPFDQKNISISPEPTKQQWIQAWTVESESFLYKGGQIVKIIAQLLLKCLDLQNISNRPYVEWLLVILCEIRTSLNGLY